MNEPQVITVKELLTSALQIPNYQRPYKWTPDNVNQLIDDILRNKNKSEYRLGTLVLHQSWKVTTNLNLKYPYSPYLIKNHYLKGRFKYDIVDGQQRTITLTLIAHALIAHALIKNGDKLGLGGELLELSFTNHISKANIQKNYKEIERRVNDFDEKTIRFFLEKCTLVQVILLDISEAFQFFDSQNSRGKDLKPHDLLKAFHLREMNNFSTEEERKKAVENWEKMDSNKLSELFSKFLFRIRNWSNKRSGLNFSKNDISMFKGVNLNKEEQYPFTLKLRMAHFYVEEYNSSYHRNIDKRKMDFPFQIDETIINGKLFFEMVEHYQKMIDKIRSHEMSEKFDLLKTINIPNGIGEGYIKNLFYCGTIYYIDKFGDQDLSKPLEKIFIWAYSLRLHLKSVFIESVNNYALYKHKHSKVDLFKKIKEAINPSEVSNLRFDKIKTESKNKVIKDKFIELNYLENDNH